MSPRNAPNFQAKPGDIFWIDSTASLIGGVKIFDDPLQDVLTGVSGTESSGIIVSNEFVIVVAFNVSAVPETFVVCASGMG